jgi:S-adenosylmethionine decarboxylase
VFNVYTLDRSKRNIIHNLQNIIIKIISKKDHCFILGVWVQEEYSTTGRHVVLDVWGVDSALLNSKRKLKKQLKLAAKACGATIVAVKAKAFKPQGVTVAVVLSESHLTIHTYPEKGFAGLDCYTCGSTVDPALAMQYLIKVLEPEQYNARLIRRGDGPMKVEPFK